MKPIHILFRKLAFWVLCAFAAVVTLPIITIGVWRPLHYAEHLTSDMRIAYFSGDSKQNSDIVILTITDEVLAKFRYRSPVDRVFLARLIELLEHRGAKAIGIDLIFDAPTDSVADDNLHQVLASSKLPMAVAYRLPDNDVSDAQRLFISRFVPVSVRANARMLIDPADDVVRWFDPVWRASDGIVDYNIAGSLAHKLGFNVEQKRVAIRWNPSRYPFKIFRADIAELLPAETFRGKVVLIGVDAPFIDRHRTPVSVATNQADISGVVIVAHELAGLMGQESSPEWPAVEMAILIVVALLVGLSLPQFAPTRHSTRFFVVWLISVTYWILCVLVWNELGVMMPLMIPTVTLIVSTFISTQMKRNIFS